MFAEICQLKPCQLPTMDDIFEIIKNKLQQKFGVDLLAAEMHYDFPVYILTKNRTKEALQFLKDDPELNFHFLTTMCGIHYPELPPEREFWLMYQLHNMQKNWRIRIKTFMPREDMNMPTVSDIWKTANWMERQEFDFFGFVFQGHPNLTRILNMEEMNYFPLRKEYPLEDMSRDDKNDRMFGR